VVEFKRKVNSMKKYIALLLLIIWSTSPGLSQESLPPHISVYGTATTEVTPDQMIWSVRVENKGPALEAVAENHNKSVQDVLQLLKSAGVEGKTLQTARMEFGENWEYKESTGRIKEGYFAATQVSFKLTNFDLYNKLWFGLAKIPNVSVQGVFFDHTRRIDFQNETRQKAVVTARDKAAMLARALGATLGEALSVEEQNAEVMPAARNNLIMNSIAATADDSEQAQALAPGTIPITTRVQATFRLVSKPK
jgi:uncharacterized protein YggE